MLSKADEIAATEKLLSKIRGKGDRPSAPVEDPLPAAPTGDAGAPLSLKLPFRRSLSVGIDIGYNELRLVKLNRSTGSRHELVHYQRVPFEPGIGRDDPQFPRFLRGVLTRFCGSTKKIELWSAISTARVEMRGLRIPKVADRHIANAVLWSFKKEVALDEKSTLLNFDILGTVSDNGVRKLEVMAYAAPRQELKDLKDLFARSGFPLRGITVFPFALQNLFRSRWLKCDSGSSCSLYIGRNWSRIDLFTVAGNLALSRGIKAGVNSMVEALRDAFNTERQVALPELASLSEFVLDSPETIAEPLSSEQAQRILLDLTHGRASIDVPGKSQPIGATQVFHLLLPALNRLVRQVQRTHEFHQLNREHGTVERVFISGEIIHYKPVVDFIEGQLNLPVKIIDPIAESPGDSHPTVSTRNTDFVPAMGLALSGNEITPNFLFTYKDREVQTSVRRINRVVFGLFLILLLISMAYDSHLERRRVSSQAVLAGLRKQMETLGPLIDESLIGQFATKLETERAALAQSGSRYQALAVVQEITALTPPEVRLLGLRAEFGGETTEGKATSRKRSVILDGVIIATDPDAELAGFLLALKRSPLFESPAIRSRKTEVLDGREVLRFTAQIELG